MEEEGPIEAVREAVHEAARAAGCVAVIVVVRAEERAGAEPARRRCAQV